MTNTYLYGPTAPEKHSDDSFEYKPLHTPPRRRWNPRRLTSEKVIFIAVLVTVFVLVVYPAIKLFQTTFIAEGTVSVAGFMETWLSADVLSALKNSAILTISSVSIAVVVGVTLAWFIKRTNVPGAKTLNRLPILPMLFPPILGGLGWVMLLAPGSGILNQLILDRMGIGVDLYTLGGTIFVESLYLIPWVHMLVASGFDSFDGNLSDASRLSGSSVISTFFRIELPLLLPHILSAALLTSVLALSSYTLPLMLASVSGDDVLAVLIATYGTNFIFPTYAAGSLSLLILVVALVGTFGQRALTSGNRFVMVGGKGASVTKIDLGAWRWIVFSGVCVYIGVTIILPVIAMLFVSLLPRWSTSMDLSEVSFANYQALFTSGDVLWQGYFTSLVLAFVSATAIMLLATVSALLGARARFRGPGMLHYLAMASIGIPSVAFGFGVLEAYIEPPLVLYGTVWAIIIGYVGGFFGIGFQQIQAAIKQLDSSLEEAARVSGSGWFGTVLRVVVPLIRSGFVAGWLLVFIICFREHPMSVLLISSDTTVVSTAMFAYYETGQFTAVAAFAMVVFVTIFSISIFATRQPQVK